LADYLKRILSITFLNFFISGGLALIIPLLLLERNVDLTEIGLILSVFPLVFMIVRLFLAALADLVGWARFYLILYWPGSLISTLIFLIAASTPFFLLGKIIEGVKEAVYWAVIRTSIFSLSPKQKGKASTKNFAILLLSIAIGSAVAGFGITFLGFSFTLSVLFFASVLIGIPAWMLWQTERHSSMTRVPISFSSLDPRGRGRKFWFVSLTLALFRFAQYPLVVLLLPIFMVQQLGYNYIVTGIVSMLYYVFASFATIGTLNRKLSFGRVVVQSLIAIFVGFLLTNSGSYFIPLILALAIAHGLGIGYYESLVAKSTKNRQTVSFDIGLLIIPQRLAEFVSVIFAGFATQYLGFMPIFVLSGISFLIFSVLSWNFLKVKNG
jgi:MFS family permease